MENSKNYGKRKNADGTVTEYTSSKPKDKQGRDSFEGAMLDFIQDVKGPKESFVDETLMEMELIKWINVQAKSVDSLLDESNIPNHLIPDAYAILTDLELSTLVNIFCAKGKKFSSDHFKKEMADMEIKPLVYHKLFKVLSEWKTMASVGKDGNGSSDSSFSTIGINESNDSVLLTMI